MPYKFDPISGELKLVAQGEKGDTGASPINKHDYSAETTYAVNDFVQYEGSTYICKLASTGNLPTNTTYWDLMAQKGADGEGTGDVVGPASAVDSNFAAFDTTTGKLIKDSGSKASDFAAALGADDNYVTDAEKTAIGTIGDKVDKVAGKGLSTNDYDDAAETKLAGIEAGAEVNNISDVNATDLTDGGATTLHKHSYNNLDDKPTIPTVPSMASSSDINTGTDTTKTINADAFAGSNFGRRVLMIPVIDNGTALAVGDGKFIFPIPVELNGMNLVQAEAYVDTVSSSGTPTISIYNLTDSVDMLSTSITIDANERDSYTAATRSVVDTTHDDVATSDRIEINVDGAGTGTKGLTVILSFQLP